MIWTQNAFASLLKKYFLHHVNTSIHQRLNISTSTQYQDIDGKLYFHVYFKKYFYLYSIWILEPIFGWVSKCWMCLKVLLYAIWPSKIEIYHFLVCATSLNKEKMNVQRLMTRKSQNLYGKSLCVFTSFVILRKR